MAAEASDRLLKYRVCPEVATLYYVPDFIDADTEAALMREIYRAPKPKWTALSNRRLQNWGGVLLPDNKGLLSEPLPLWLTALTARVDKLGVFEGKTANHVLVNEYLSGQGIMPHEDGPAFSPYIATVSLGAHGVLEFYAKKDFKADADELQDPVAERQPFVKLLLQPRSLLVVRHDMYKCLHGIAERKKDFVDNLVGNRVACAGVDLHDTLERGTRVSLTIRNVATVKKMPKLGLARR